MEALLLRRTYYLQHTQCVTRMKKREQACNVPWFSRLWHELVGSVVWCSIHMCWTFKYSTNSTIAPDSWVILCTALNTGRIIRDCHICIGLMKSKKNFRPVT
jgi:hypothetical protein